MVVQLAPVLLALLPKARLHTDGRRAGRRWHAAMACQRAGTHLGLLFVLHAPSSGLCVLVGVDDWIARAWELSGERVD